MKITDGSVRIIMPDPVWSVPSCRIRRKNSHKAPRQALYCRLVPVAWKGKYHVRVRSYDEKELVRTTFTINKPAPCYWMQFAGSKHSGNQEKLIEKDTPTHIVRPSPMAAVPKFNDIAPVWPTVDRKGNPLRASPKKNPSLPGQIPMGLPWVEYYLKPRTLKDGAVPRGLKLTLDKGDFLIRSETGMAVSYPDPHLLARWWVNGKPVLPPRAGGLSRISIGAKSMSGREIRVAFALPGTLGKLKPGDKIALQVMYSPTRIQQIPGNRFTEKQLFARECSTVPNVPLLSNRLEFVVQEAMLAGGAPTSRPTTTTTTSAPGG